MVKSETWLFLVLLFVFNHGDAVELGKVSVYSATDQPLRAAITLNDWQPSELDDLSVHMASAEDFAKAGVAYANSMAAFEFAIDKSSSGATISITSPQPTAGPFVSFILDVRTRGKRTLKEYTVLLPPPTGTVLTGNRTETDTDLLATGGVLPTEKSVSTTGSSFNVGDFEGDINVEIVGSTADVPDDWIGGKTGSFAEISETGLKNKMSGKTNRLEIVVQPGTTLMDVASRDFYPGIPVPMIATAIFHANKSSFIGENPDLLKAGSVLLIPNLESLKDTHRADAQTKQRIPGGLRKEEQLTSAVKHSNSKVKNTPSFMPLPSREYESGITQPAGGAVVAVDLFAPEEDDKYVPVTSERKHPQIADLDAGQPETAHKEIVQLEKSMGASGFNDSRPNLSQHSNANANADPSRSHSKTKAHQSNLGDAVDIAVAQQLGQSNRPPSSTLAFTEESNLGKSHTALAGFGLLGLAGVVGALRGRQLRKKCSIFDDKFHVHQEFRQSSEQIQKAYTEHKLKATTGLHFRKSKRSQNKQVTLKNAYLAHGLLSKAEQLQMNNDVKPIKPDSTTQAKQLRGMRNSDANRQSKHEAEQGRDGNHTAQGYTSTIFKKQPDRLSAIASDLAAGAESDYNLSNNEATASRTNGPMSSSELDTLLVIAEGYFGMGDLESASSVLADVQINASAEQSDRVAALSKRLIHARNQGAASECVPALRRLT